MTLREVAVEYRSKGKPVRKGVVMTKAQRPPAEASRTDRQAARKAAQALFKKKV